MFYSHEILTSRKGGVATVWLVATLGSRSGSKKINRKAILDVDIPRTCRIIIEPEAPMALRLQSNLLYGVSRVFNQQCTYILSDAQTAQSNMARLLNFVKTSDLDPDAGKARPDQLIIHDDPAFVPDFALPGLDIDLSALDISSGSSRRSSILSHRSQRSSLSSQPDADEAVGGLIIPSSDSGGVGDLGGFILPSDNMSSAQRSARIGGLLEDEDEGFNLDPGFTIDADGNLIEGNTPDLAAAPPVGVRLGSDSAASVRVRQELLEGLEAGQYQPGPTGLDLDLPQFDDPEIILPNAEPFPEMAPPPTAGKSSSEAARERELSQSAEAPLQRKARAPKELPIDERPELHNSDLAQWKIDYATNMLEAKEAKQLSKAASLAKKNAAFWVYGAGIGGVGVGVGSSMLKSPLDMFAGEAMMEALTGIQNSSTPRKRRHNEEEEDHDSDSEARRVRMRDDGGQVGRGDHMVLNYDDDMMISAGSDGIEVGRHAVAPLEDQSFPWNVSSALGSRHGSVARGHGFASSVGGFPTSAGQPSSLPGIGGAAPSSLDRRASRIRSASPLDNRGRGRYSSLELPPHEDDDELLGGRLNSSDQALDDFQLYGPAAAVDTQTAAQSQWIKATLEQEAHNFLDFVKTEISTVPAPTDEDEDELSGDGQSKTSVQFEQLLPPAQHTRVVASQALHHILALASKSLINVKQMEAFGPIDLSMPPNV